MPLIPKSAILQIRLSPDLLARFQSCCDAQEATVSEVLRRFMHREAIAYEEHVAKKAYRASQAVPVPVPPSDAFELEKTPSRPSKAVSGAKNRQQRRADKKRGL